LRLRVIAALVVVGLASGWAGPDGRATWITTTPPPTIEAAFPSESYRPGDVARLVIWKGRDDVSLQIFHAGTERGDILSRDLMKGDAVTDEWPIGRVGPGRVIRFAVGKWPSGLYYAMLRGSEGKRIGYAPFVVTPRFVGGHSVAVVLATMTWQAYNLHDDNGDGRPDSWYVRGHGPHARLGRPFLNRGVPPHYKDYDQPFLRWLIRNRFAVDYFADADLARGGVTGRKLAEAYELIVFPGHHEYVTRHEYDVVLRFRNLGGNLMFLSANNFFWKVVKHGRVMHRVERWRALGRPEAALIGVQYFGNDDGQDQSAWIVRDARDGNWIFSGTDLVPGSRLGRGGIEADHTAPSSPPEVEVLAEIPHIFHRRLAAQMTYYETPRGAKVFAAGAFTLAGSVWWPNVRQLMANLWSVLADDGNRSRLRASRSPYEPPSSSP
jgi:hypothetical protein